MTDGGMGSIRLYPPDVDDTARAFGQQIAQAEFVDQDGVPVSVAINVDQDGHLYELDLWKIDFSKLVRYPTAAEIRVLPQNEEDKCAT